MVRFFVVSCLVCSSLAAGNQLQLARLHAFKLGGEIVRIEGTSMEPRLMNNDFVVVVPVHWSELNPGDMVQFYVSEKIRSERDSLPTWVHQICHKSGSWIRTAGVNNPELDPFWVHKRDVVGKVVAVYLGGSEGESVSDKALAYFKSKPEVSLGKY